MTSTSNTSDVDDREPPRKKGTVQRLAGLVALTAVFGSVFVAATSAPSAADWREECVFERCSGGEKQELFEDFDNECVDEGCWAEEVAEIAGVGLTRSGNYTDRSLVNSMMRDFQRRSSYNVYAIEINPGRTGS